MSDLSDKLLARGVAALTDAELLDLLLGEEECGLGERLLKSFGGRLAEVGRAEVARLRMAEGIGLKRAMRVQSAVEMGRRILEEQGVEREVIRTSDDVVRLFRPRMEGLPHEECWCVFLTASNRIIESRRMSQGGVQQTVVDHRLIVKRALELLATQIILIHNHPSGAATPSEADCTLTERTRAAADLFDIRLLDHLIIAREGDFSFRQAGILH